MEIVLLIALGCLHFLFEVVFGQLVPASSPSARGRRVRLPSREFALKLLPLVLLVPAGLWLLMRLTIS